MMTVSQAAEKPVGDTSIRAIVREKTSVKVRPKTAQKD